MTGTMAPRKAAMTPDALAGLISASGLNKVEVCAKLEVSRMTLNRWLRGETPINLAWATVARARLKPKK